MPTIQLSALDTLFFRDGKPFSMGEETFAEGMFPPPPSVFHGALRAAYIAQKEGAKPFQELLDESAGIKITAIYYYFDNNFQFPMPLDYVERKAKENEAICLDLVENSFSGKDVPFLGYANEHVEQALDAVIVAGQLGNYLDGNTPKINMKKWSSLTTNEIKFGNSRNNDTRSTSDEDGNVYRVGMRRMENSNYNNLKFIVSYEFSNEIKAGLLKLGAEGKSVEVSLSNSSDVHAEVLSDKHFKILLQTPALFDSGDEPSLDWFLNLGFEVKLLTKMVGKPLRLGGWDIRKKEPKPMLLAAPAGSIYYFEITNDKTVKQLQESCAQIHSISDQRQNEGFGLFKIANLIFNPKSI